MIRLRFRRPYRANLGPHYGTGEVAAFDDLTGADLITRGVAEVAEPAPPAPVPTPAKQIEQPPVDKMVRKPGKSK